MHSEFPTAASGHPRRVRAALWPALLGVVLHPLGAHAQESASLEELAAEATRAVVLIDAETPSGNRQGSGFLVDANGRILTNYHVIRDARSLRVKLSSGDMYDVVTVLATDDRRDLAVIQVAGFDLPALPLGNSDSVRIGHPVVLIGSPLGLENTVTTGVLSGRRQEPEGFQLMQISAPASRGSSGGPVLSQNGNVVAIASSQMQVGQNLNFAVPINYARGLLSHLDGNPLVVLRPRQQPGPGEPAPMAAAADNTVNRGLEFDVSSFGGYNIETETRSRDEALRRTRITYRVIETVGGGEPRIERYLESETTRRTGPFETEQTIRRERVRTLVRVNGLQPVSTRGEVARWTGESWEQAEYDLDFDGYHVRGLISDSTGRVEEIDRDLPVGVILREVSDLAFATLAADSLVGRSVEFVAFDPLTGDVTNDRYDIRNVTSLSVADQTHQALRVTVARDLSNTTAYFTIERPRMLLRRESDGGGTEEVIRLDIHPE